MNFKEQKILAEKYLSNNISQEHIYEHMISIQKVTPYEAIKHCYVVRVEELAEIIAEELEIEYSEEDVEQFTDAMLSMEELAEIDYEEIKKEIKQYFKDTYLEANKPSADNINEEVKPVLINDYSMDSSFIQVTNQLESCYDEIKNILNENEEGTLKYINARNWEKDLRIAIDVLQSISILINSINNSKTF